MSTKLKSNAWLIGCLLGASALTACHPDGSYSGGGGSYPPPSGGGGGYYDDPYYNDPYYGGGYGGAYSSAWYDVYGHYCGAGDPRPGCNFFWDGRKVQAHEDPYYYGHSFFYSTWYYYDTYGYSRSFTGYGWMSPDGVLYDEWGFALNNGEDQDSRDLIGDVAEKEKEVITLVGKDFAQKYALSESAGISIARTLNDWATLSMKQKRARTSQDVADFSKRLYGVSVESALSALSSAKKGDVSGIDGLNAEVATFWGTTPETSKAVLKSWYSREMDSLGIH